MCATWRHGRMLPSAPLGGRRLRLTAPGGLWYGRLPYPCGRSQHNEDAMHLTGSGGHCREQFSRTVPITRIVVPPATILGTACRDHTASL